MSSFGEPQKNFEFPSQVGKVNARQSLIVKAVRIKNPDGLFVFKKPSIPWNFLLSRAGFSSYSEYLKSEHWHQFRSKFLSRSENKVCFVCGSSPVQVHHKHYRRLGKEQFGDVVSLCQSHHKHLHDVHNSLGKFGTKRFTRDYVKAAKAAVLAAAPSL